MRLDIGDSNKPREDGLTGNWYLDNVVLEDLKRSNAKRNKNKISEEDKKRNRDINKMTIVIFIIVLLLLKGCGA